MKRLLLAVAAVASVAAPGVALADHDRPYDGRYYGAPYYGEPYYGDRPHDPYGRYDRDYDRYERGYARVWRRGDHLPARLRGDWVNWRRHGLRPPADRNNAWFRVGDQLVMANVYNGLVAVAVWRR